MDLLAHSAGPYLPTVSPVHRALPPVASVSLVTQPPMDTAVQMANSGMGRHALPALHLASLALLMPPSVLPAMHRLLSYLQPAVNAVGPRNTGQDPDALIVMTIVFSAWEIRIGIAQNVQ